MKRPLIITIGIVIIFLVLGLWIYLIVFGTPQKPQEVFSNLGFIPASEPSTVHDGDVVNSPTQIASTTQVALSGKQLQQLTTRAVAGFAFVQGTSTNTVRYVEKGTGHVFEIDLATGVEKQISLTTIPGTAEAVFSPQADAITFTSYTDDISNTSVGILMASSSQMQLQQLPTNAANIAFKNDNTLYFTVDNGTKTIGYSFDIENAQLSTLFSYPLTNMRAVWGNGLSHMYLITKPASTLEGYAYAVTKNSLDPVSDQGYGLSALMNNSYIVETFVQNKNYVSYALNNGLSIKQALVMLPEKCVFGSATGAIIWCAAPFGNSDDSFVENWYKGTITSKDYLWYTDVTSKTSLLIGDLAKLSGRIIDVNGITINQAHTQLLLRDKLDGSLWLFTIKAS